MERPVKLIVILLTLFFITQLIGIFVIGQYSPEIIQTNVNGTLINQTEYKLPYGLNPQEQTNQQFNIISFIISFIFVILLMILLMKMRSEVFLRVWFFVVIVMALSISINSFMLGMKLALTISLIIALVLAYYKVFKRDILVHNFTELFIYPGVAAALVPFINITGIIVLFILFSIYDMYMVWHTGLMQKMAKYQITQVKVFGGFLIPYMLNKDKLKYNKLKGKNKKGKISVAALGGGDVVFPLLMAGVVLARFNFLSALIISIGATIALAGLFIYSKHGKAYPALPFISIGCFIALAVVYWIN